MAASLRIDDGDLVGNIITDDPRRLLVFIVVAIGRTDAEIGGLNVLGIDARPAANNDQISAMAVIVLLSASRPFRRGLMTPTVIDADVGPGLDLAGADDGQIVRSRRLLSCAGTAVAGQRRQSR